MFSKLCLAKSAKSIISRAGFEIESFGERKHGFSDLKFAQGRSEAAEPDLS